MKAQDSMVPIELPVSEDMGVGEDSAHLGVSATPGFSSEVADMEANTNHLYCVLSYFQSRRLCEHNKIIHVFNITRCGGIFLYNNS